MLSQNHFDQELIFLVLPNQQVNLEQVTYESIILQHQVQIDLTLQGTMNALKYRFPLKYLGISYQQIVLPCIPAKQPQLISDSSRPQQIHQFCTPFVKTSKITQKKGYASGKRSAIIQTQNLLIRYKGCGNLLQGFSVENNEPRGCHYFHTSKRQLLMTRRINQILLKELSILSGNIPKLAFEYKASQIRQKNLSFEKQMIGKYCCVFETVGDRRAGTHIISPLQILYLNLCDVEEIKWIQIFEQNNRMEYGQPIEFIIDWLFLKPGQTFLQSLLEIQNNQNFVTLQSVIINNINAEKKNIFIQKVLYQLAKNSDEKKFVECYLKDLQINFKQLVNVILEKVGYQMGEIKRIFCDYQINWGYFNDHGDLWHCNAHLNNFVSTIPKQDSQFLVPIDFDMSFFKCEFIKIDLSPESESSYGKSDNDLFENFLSSEYQAMQMSVSGIEVMSNFKYSIDYDEGKKLSPLSPIKMGRIAFRDTLLRAFKWGMRKNSAQKQKINSEWNKNIKQIRQLIKVCLIISQDFQT